MSTIIRFKPASNYTKNAFNAWGLSPHDAVLETQVWSKGYAPVDLTILKTVSGSYVFAHGAVVNENRFPNDKKARAAARSWYRENCYRFKSSQ